jgi:hypothetical protein
VRPRTYLIGPAIIAAVAAIALRQRADEQQRVRDAAGTYVMRFAGDRYNPTVEMHFALRPEGRWSRATRVFDKGGTVRTIDADSGSFGFRDDLVEMRTDGANRRLHLYVLRNDSLVWSGLGNPALGNVVPEQLIFVRER